MIDRYLLRYMLAVIDHGTFSKAAAACHVSQPTLSAGIAKLEAALGRPLFHRNSRRVALTEAGVRLATHARTIEGEFLRAERAIAGTSPRSPLRIGVLLTIPIGWIDAFIATLPAELAATTAIEIVEGRERDLTDRLTRGRIDAALTLMRAGDMRHHHTTLFTEGYTLALPAAHPLAANSVITAQDLADCPMIARRHCEVLSETSRFFTNRGVRPPIPARTHSDERTLHYIRSGLGITVMPACYQMAGVARRPLADFTLERTIGIIGAPTTPEGEAVLDHLATVISDQARFSCAPASPFTQ